MNQKTKIKITPYGGLREIGSNLCVFNGGSENIILDAGILFPYESCFNLNYLIPDLSQIDPEITRNIIFTHGHEDHIGAVYHIVEKFPDIKIWASKFTAKLIQRKLGFYQMKSPIHIFDENSTLEFKDLTFHPIHLNHSIPETFGFVIQDRKKYWSCFFASDFKVDRENPYEKPCDFKKAKNLISKSPHRLAMLDSTNILYDKKTMGEGDLLKGIEEIVEDAPSRLFITQFSSNIHRMQSILNACHKNGKKLIPIGRSMEFYMGAAEDTGLLSIPPKTLYSKESENLEDHRNVFLVSGCQGDFFSSLKRIVFGEYRDIKLLPEDTVAFSSKVIPGNEKTIFRMYNKIIESGSYLITAKNKNIHASGHPGQEDLHEVFRNLDFTDHLPIHGESLFLKRHQEFIQKNYPQVNSHLALNFDRIDLNENGEIHIHQGESLPPILIHGKGVEIERAQVAARRKIAQKGLIHLIIAKSHVYIDLMGLPLFCDDFKQELESFLKHYLRRHLKNRKIEYKKQELATKARRFFYDKLGYKPSCTVSIVD